MMEVYPRRCFIYILVLWDLFSQNGRDRQSHISNRVMGSSGYIFRQTHEFSVIHIFSLMAQGLPRICAGPVLVYWLVLTIFLCIFNSQGGRALAWVGMGAGGAT